MALLSLAPALLALRSGDLAAYHGVEHKAIAAYEKDADAADADKEHDRCGSHLVAPMLAAATLGNVAARRAGLRGPAAEAAVGLGSAAVAVEVFAWGERHPDSRVTRLLRRPGHEIQRVVGTREPTAEQLEVGRAALEEILRVEARPAQPPVSARRLVIPSSHGHRGQPAHPARPRASSGSRSRGSATATTRTPTSTSPSSCWRSRDGTRG